MVFIPPIKCLSKSYADFFADTISYRLKPAVYLFVTILWAYFINWGKPMTCWPNENWKPDSTVSLESVCISNPLMPLNNSEFIGKDPIKYYNSVPYSMLLAILLQYIPYAIWTVCMLPGIKIDLNLIVSRCVQEGEQIETIENAGSYPMEEFYLWLTRDHPSQKPTKTLLKWAYFLYKLLQLGGTLAEFVALSYFLASGNYWRLSDIAFKWWSTYARLTEERFRSFPKKVACYLYINTEGEDYRDGYHTCDCHLSAQYEWFFTFLWLFLILHIVIILCGIRAKLFHNDGELVDRALNILKETEAAKISNPEEKAHYLSEFQYRASDFKAFLGSDGLWIFNLIRSHTSLTIAHRFCRLVFKYHEQCEKRRLHSKLPNDV